MHNKSLITLSLASLLAVSSAMGQTCKTDSIAESTPASRFIAGETATVTDTETKLVWARCSLGQDWTGKTCSGTPEKYSWQEATEIVKKLNDENFEGHADWRLPQIPELASIVERQCFDPRVNIVVFPATSPVSYWSATERKGYVDYAYVLNFGAGETGPSHKDYKGPVRLVSGGPWWKPPKMP